MMDFPPPNRPPHCKTPTQAGGKPVQRRYSLFYPPLSPLRHRRLPVIRGIILYLTLYFYIENSSRRFERLANSYGVSHYGTLKV